MNEILLKVLTTCIPVFAIMWLGYLLRKKGFMTTDAHSFLNKFVFYFSLPLLIYTGIASSDLKTLFQPVVFWSTVPVILFVGTLFTIIGKFLKLPVSQRSVMSITSFWGNTVYLGFPLTLLAFGEKSLNYAAMMNAVSLPFMVGFGTFLLGGEGKGGKKTNLKERLLPLLKNPVIQAVFLGILSSFLIHQGNLKSLPENYKVFEILLTLFNGTTQFLKSTGMPLALLVVGGSINLDKIHGQKGTLIVSSFAKLILTPAISFAIAYLFFRSTPLTIIGPTVLLTSVPLSVSACIVSAQMGADEELVAATLVTTTVIACLTLPLWIGILLYYFG